MNQSDNLFYTEDIDIPEVLRLGANYTRMNISFERVISGNDIRNNWCLTYLYGGNDWWPRLTQCLVTCSIQWKKRGRWHLITGNKDEDCWELFTSNKNGHAEDHMIEYIESKIRKKEKDEEIDISKCKMSIVISYSPCDGCSKKLINFMERRKKSTCDISLEILFANFYGCQRLTIEKNCTYGLVSLLLNGIKLRVFDRKYWDWLLYDVLCLRKCRTLHSLLDKNELEERKNRELIDKQVLRCLKKFAKEHTQPLSQSEEETFLLNLVEVVRSKTCGKAEKEANRCLRGFRKALKKNEELIAEIVRKWYVSKMYGEDAHQWPTPSQGFLYCKIQLKRTRRHDIVITGNGGEDCWMKFFKRADVHAEVQMANYLKSEIIQEENDRKTSIKKCTIKAALNTSPCNECAAKLIELVRWLKMKGADVEIEIVFANFYGCHRLIENNCITGLVEMLMSDIELIVFNEKTWDWLINNVLCIRRSFDFKQFVNEVDHDKIEERKEREGIDAHILTCVEEVADLYEAPLRISVNLMRKLVHVAKSKTSRAAKRRARIFVDSVNNTSSDENA